MAQITVSTYDLAKLATLDDWLSGKSISETLPCGIAGYVDTLRSDVEAALLSPQVLVSLPGADGEPNYYGPLYTS